MTEPEALRQIALLCKWAAAEPPDRGVLYGVVSDVLWLIEHIDQVAAS